MTGSSCSKLKLAAATALTAFVTMFASPADASLVAFKGYFGPFGLSTDGVGDPPGNGNSNLVVNAPTGSEIVSAYLYTSMVGGDQDIVPSTVSLGGTLVGGFSARGINVAAGLQAYRADVTSIIAPIVNAGPGGAYNFAYSEGNQSPSIDGSALVVVYRNTALPNQSVGIYDGFSESGGDTFTVNLGDPLDKTVPGFAAEMRLGIGFSCCGQASQVSVNGTVITNLAGNNDETGVEANGQLITMGGDDDPFSPLLPSYAEDHERYSIASLLNQGDTSIKIDTVNPSSDDNIFVAAFLLSARAGFDAPPPEDPCIGDPNLCIPNNVPEPGTMAAFGAAMAGWAVLRRRRHD